MWSKWWYLIDLLYRYLGLGFGLLWAFKMLDLCPPTIFILGLKCITPIAYCYIISIYYILSIIYTDTWHRWLTTLRQYQHGFIPCLTVNIIIFIVVSTMLIPSTYTGNELFVLLAHTIPYTLWRMLSTYQVLYSHILPSRMCEMFRMFFMGQQQVHPHEERSGCGPLRFQVALRIQGECPSDLTVEPSYRALSIAYRRYWLSPLVPGYVYTKHYSTIVYRACLPTRYNMCDAWCTAYQAPLYR